MRLTPSRRFSNDGILAASVSATAVAVSGLLAFAAHDFGPRTAHMAIHIAAMSVVAPAAAALLSCRLPKRVSGTGMLWLAAVAQVLLLWAWHVPAAERWTSASHALMIGAHVSLLLAALVFWSAVIRAAAQTRWHAIAALLLTGKLTCLLSALLVFSPRALYGGAHHAADLGDQQLAGLLMITACPLSYLVAAVVIVARIVGGATPDSRRSQAALG